MAYKQLTKEERAQKEDDYYKEVAEFFIDAIKTNTAPWMKPCNGQDYLYPMNPVTGTVYSGMNSLRLGLIQEIKYKSEDPRWLTFVNIRENGYGLEKGSRGVPIRFFSQVPVDSNGKIISPAESGTREIAKYMPTHKTYIVFHASGITGLPPLEKKEVLDKPVIIQNAEDILINSKAQIFHDSHKNYYQPATDEIHLVKRENFLSPELYYCTALHELSHWTGASSRLDRNIKNTFGTEAYAKEELRAEIGSYMICKDLRLDFEPQNHIAYVQSWCKAIKDSPNEITKACYDADKIKDFCVSFSQKKENVNTLEEKNTNRKSR